MTRFLLTCATLISVVLLPVPTMSADITVKVRDLKGKSIADADRVNGSNSQIQINVTGLDTDRRESELFTAPVQVPNRDSVKIPIPDSYAAVKLVISDVTGGRVPATVDAASNTVQTIVVAMPEKQPATQNTPMYYAVCPPVYYAVSPPAVVQCVPIRPVRRHCWFRHR